MKTSFPLVALLVAILGCSPQQTSPPARSQSTATPSACDRARDQQAIAAMAGSYDVEFAFEETEALAPGYRKHEGHKSFATELIVVVEDTPGRVSLQHLLQLGDGPRATVIKHWRQDWVFQGAERLEFRGRDVWERRTLTAQAARCSWTQAVYGVDDAPRYSGSGRWRHTATSSAWTSNETWRPLPRREYTTRSDYDVLVAVNEHRVDRDGWQHVQRNAKLVLEPRHFLVREQGLNRYGRAAATSTDAAAAYWQAAAPFWRAVREEWSRLLARHPRLTLRSEATGQRLHQALFERALARAPVDDATRTFIRDLLERYVASATEHAGATAAAR